MQIQGPNPQTGETINRSDCIDNWLPMLTIENSQQQRQTAASVDKVATEINKFHENMIKMNEMTLRQLSSRVSHTAVMEHNTYGPFDKQ